MINRIHSRPSRRCWLLVVLGLMSGCGGGEQAADREFTTSGSPDADQRAQQRMMRHQQYETDEGAAGTPLAPEQTTLYERLGGDAGIQRIVDDFVDRALVDPRVNWTREGVPRGGLVVPIGSVEWEATPENVLRLKQHMAQFLAVAAGGPAQYKGRNLKDVHAHMRITNAEFDAAVGDLKATLDRLGVPDPEQKELLAIVESTRPQVAEER